MLKRLFDLSHEQSSCAHLISVWTVDYADEGDAAVLNEAPLHDRRPEICTTSLVLYSRSLIAYLAIPRLHANAICILLESGVLNSSEMGNLIGLGHGTGVFTL
jgi:hypothetical protein